MSHAIHTPTRYAAPAKFMHWLMAIMILGSLTVGLVMVWLPEGPVQDQLFANHEAFGFLILVAALIRIAVRAFNPAPAPSASLSRFERIASVSTHHLFYILMVAMPLLGILGKGAYDGSALSVFGLFQVPTIVSKNEALADIIWTAHRTGGYLFALLVTAHITGALMHLRIKKDGVFQRMWPGRA